MKYRFAFVCADADGRLSNEELSTDSRLSGSFSIIDGNSDGYVTLEEFRSKVKTKPGKSGSQY